ncbi:MAG: hypothetical protein V2A79_13280 [Planctomycetota bacterium]
MRTMRTVAVAAVLVTALWVSGCTSPKVDFSTIKQPARAAELDKFKIFVGDWTWEADVINAEGTYKHWKGKAKWNWILDERCLHGTVSAESGDKKFDAAGIWSWHPTQKKYFWWMFNNWGYPQQGAATYDDEAKTWCMTYTSVGLDGTTSYGRYTMKVVDNNTLDWQMQEWVDAMHMMPKMEMKGTYKKQKG